MASRIYAEIATTVDEGDAEVVLIDVVVGGGEDFTLIDIVDIDGRKDLRLDEVVDASPGHARDGDVLLDLLEGFSSES